MTYRNIARATRDINRPVAPATESEDLFDEAAAAAATTPASKTPPTFRISAILDDFPFELEFAGDAAALKATVARLREIGAVPPTRAAAAAVEEERKREAPVCEYHGPMKESTKRPGTFYCPAKMGDGSYCKSKA